MNTKQISNRKAAFMLAMAEDPKDINHAVAPAELMAIIAHTNPIQFEDGIGTLFMDSGVDEETYYDYLMRRQCNDESMAEIRNSFLMDPVRAKLNKIKYEKGLIPDDEILAFALFLVGNSRIVEEYDVIDENELYDMAELVNSTANRLKFLLQCMSEGRYDILNTVIQFTHKKMETNVDCVYCFDEVTPEDGGVLEYYKQMTARVEHGKTFDHETEMEKAFWERYQKSYDDWSRKQTENMSPPVSRYNDDEDDEIPKHMNDDEPLVERDFEG